MCMVLYDAKDDPIEEPLFIQKWKTTVGDTFQEVVDMSLLSVCALVRLCQPPRSHNISGILSFQPVSIHGPTNPPTHLLPHLFAPSRSNGPIHRPLPHPLTLESRGHRSIPRGHRSRPQRARQDAYEVRPSDNRSGWGVVHSESKVHGLSYWCTNYRQIKAYVAK